MTAPDIDELFAQTLKGDYEDEEPWDAVYSLRRLGSRAIFDRAAEWCMSDKPIVRARGVDVLAQLGKTLEHPINAFPNESYQLVASLVRIEKELPALSSGIAALGHLDNPLAVPIIASFHQHPNAEVRFSVACALGSFPNDDSSVSALLLLMEDEDEDVRDWATFGLGSLSDMNSEAIRDALFGRINDVNEDVREEALVGLAKRRDTRVLPTLFALVKGPEIKIRVAEAASLMLGMENDPDRWGAQEYRAALEARFAE